MAGHGEIVPSVVVPVGGEVDLAWVASTEGLRQIEFEQVAETEAGQVRDM